MTERTHDCHDIAPSAPFCLASASKSPKLGLLLGLELESCLGLGFRKLQSPEFHKYSSYKRYTEGTQDFHNMIPLSFYLSWGVSDKNFRCNFGRHKMRNSLEPSKFSEMRWIRPRNEYPFRGIKI